MFLRKTAILAGLIAALSLGAADAFARAGGGSSSGSRGARSFSMPSSTPTAPRSAAPLERSMTPQPSFTPGATGARPGFFSGGGFGRGLLGGLLGAGLIGMLLGHGFMGGLGGLFSLLGLLLQVGLIFLVVRFALNYFRGRQQPSFAGGAPDPRNAAYRTSTGPLPGGASAPPPQQPLEIAKADFDVFERRLGEVQAAYSAEDMNALARVATPEMTEYFRQEIAANAAKGLVNRIGGVRLLQGDLAESWREPGAEYATVAMRFSLTDAMIERASGKVVQGSTTNPEQATELWTFRRMAGGDAGGWGVSAIQQAR